MKRILSLFIFMIAVITMSISACAAAPEINEGASSVTVSNISEDDFLIAAIYNNNKALEGVKVYKNTGEAVIDYNKDIFPSYEDADFMKLFVWTDKQQPKMTAYGIDIKKYKGQDGETPASKTLVAYFSATGTTKALAEKFAAAADADIFEIVPSEPYTSADLNYNSDCRANREQNDDSSRPAIANTIENFDSYDTIIIGHPIWWGTIPRIIYTFMDTYDLSGKNVYTFCTSGSTGISTAVSDVKKYAPNANLIDGMRGTSSTTEEQIKSWLEGNGYNK